MSIFYECHDYLLYDRNMNIDNSNINNNDNFNNINNNKNNNYNNNGRSSFIEHNIMSI